MIVEKKKKRAYFASFAVEQLLVISFETPEKPLFPPGLCKGKEFRQHAQAKTITGFTAVGLDRRNLQNWQQTGFFRGLSFQLSVGPYHLPLTTYYSLFFFAFWLS